MKLQPMDLELRFVDSGHYQFFICCGVKLLRMVSIDSVAWYVVTETGYEGLSQDESASYEAEVSSQRGVRAFSPPASQG